MRTLTCNLFMSVDGVVESPGDWSMAYWNDDIAGVMGEATEDVDGLVLGRVTYEEFAPAWSGRSTEDDQGAAFFNGVRKHVATSTLTAVDWNNSEILAGDVVAAVAALKQADGGRLMSSGSPTLTRSLLRAGLVDELNLLVYPVIVGSGKRLAAGDDGQIPLTLTRSTGFENGVVHMVYAGPSWLSGR